MVFTDIVGSTAAASALGDRHWCEVLDRYDHLVDRLLASSDGRRVKGTGDGTLATFPLPTSAVRWAVEMRDAARSLGVVLRAGVHCGEFALRSQDIAGTAVNIAARVQTHADADEVLVSRTIVDLVAGSGIRFTDRGAFELRGLPGPWNLYSIAELSPAPELGLGVS